MTRNNKLNKLIKIDSDTHKKLMTQKRELSVIENRNISAGEVIQRVLKGEDIPDRLRIGAIERKRRGLGVI